MIKEQLTERSKDFNIIIEDIAIVDMTFGREYTQAIEAKQIAQQEAQRAMFVVEQAIQEKQQKIVQAEGEAQSVTLLGDAVKQNPGYLKLRRIRAAQKIASIVKNWFKFLFWYYSQLFRFLSRLTRCIWMRRPLC